MVKIYSDKEVQSSILREKKISVIGYGSQGRAQALNIRDSGIRVFVGLRKGPSWERAAKDGFMPLSIPDAVKKGDVIHMLIPDTVQPTVYKKQIAPFLTPGKTLSFAHGFNIHFKTILPPSNVDVVMVAPKGPGLSVREMYVKGFGVPALIAVQQDYTGKAKDTVLAMAKTLGCTMAGVIETTFKDETESDLIGEQTVLVGGVMELIRNGFEVLINLGYPPELAYFEACNEMKLIVDQIYRNGIAGMLRAVSDTAKYGGLSVGSKVIDHQVRKNMEKAAEKVRNGKFAQEWLAEDAKGRPNMKALLQEWETHPLEIIGEKIRTITGISKRME